MLYVNVYQRKRCYGGPEEGGWYYDAWEPIEQLDDDGNYYNPARYISRQVPTSSEARRAKDYFETEYAYPKDCRADSLYEIRIEKHPPRAGSNYQPYS